MDDVTDMMAEDATRPVEVPQDEALRSIVDLANEQLQLEAAVVDQERRLKELKEELAKVREADLPAALEAIGMSSFSLKNGSKITIREEVYAAITDERRDDAFRWLEETGNDGIIKNEVKCPFGKGQDAEAKRLMDSLVSGGYSFTNSRTVHPMTLKAFVKDRLQSGSPIPTDVFGVHVKKISKIEVS